MLPSPAIAVEGLRVSYGRREVLRGIDLRVAAGEVFALLGPNGAGKTTTVSVLTTLVRPTAGAVLVGGVDVRRDPEGVKRRISLTGQSAAVDEMLTGRENVVMFARLAGLPRREAATRATELLARFGLVDAADKGVRTYSGGMRRRLDLALSVVVPPEILFLDEPTTGLDPRSRLQLWDAIRDLARGGTTILLTTQYLEDADQLADRVAVIDGGRIVALDTPALLKARVGGTSIEVHDEDGRLLRTVPTDGTLAGVRAALDALPDAPGDAVTLRRPTLDDVFLALTGGHPHADDALPVKELA